MVRRLAGITMFSLGLILAGRAQADPPAPPSPSPSSPEAPQAPEASPGERGRAWLAAHQNEDGSFGGTYSTAVTGLACLAWLASDDDPYAGEKARPWMRGLAFLLGQQKDGCFPQQGHTWIHGQGFATLALAEAYGRTILGKTQPDIDVEVMRDVLTKAVDVIAKSQSTSGGWWYVQGQPHLHEGSTTVCAVQALVSAANFGIPIDEDVLARGFEYLKQCQNPDGGFDYKLGDAHSMKEGTAADVATLALMRRFDYQVMTEGVRFLETFGPSQISRERFPYYGHFYACMGLTLFGEEMGAEDDAMTYTKAAHADVHSWQAEDGSWPLKGWMTAQQGATPAYATAFAALLLSVPEKRLSIFHRRPPELPAAPSSPPKGS